jgi:phosphoglucosamine mutase
MNRLFGTDGVRGVANSELTPDLALALGRAAGRVLAPDGGEVVVGRDTRISGPMLEAALVAGLCSSGVHVRLAGVLPTPAIAFLTIDEKGAAGAMISASHNPVPDNGIKFFSDEGLKIPARQEQAIETLMASTIDGLPTGIDVGDASSLDGALDRYVDHLLRSIESPLRGVRIVIDCAHGAAHRAAPHAFREAGADVTVIHGEADGARINVDCGSTAPEVVARRVVDEGADLGIAFDGDADRAVAIDENGRIVDGDRIIAMTAFDMHDRGALMHDVVVTTVMANLGFLHALEERGIQVVSAPVGDKFVAEAMAEHGASLGGEQSGHIIFADHSTTGDGVMTGLKIAELVARADQPLSVLSDVFETYPQVLLNVRVEDKNKLRTAEDLWDEVKRVESRLAGDGRVLIRPSGTEPVVRVMVEASDEATARTTAEHLSEVVARALS